jgi:16S rRNA (guanine527-N7)-methyltransferase
MGTAACSGHRETGVGHRIGGTRPNRRGCATSSVGGGGSPGHARDDDRGRYPLVASDAYPPRVTQPGLDHALARAPRVPLPTDAGGLPGLGDLFRDTLDSGLRALGLTLTPAAAVAIDHQARLLLAWNRHINLTAIRTPEGVARLHVIDALSAVPVLQGRLPRAPSILDLGSGGGYPGLPLALALPAGRLTLLDSVAKKARFLDVVARMAMSAQTDVPEPVTVEAMSARAEQLAAGPGRETWDAVTVRAVGTLSEVAELGLPLLRRGGLLVCWKRESSQASPPFQAAPAASRASVVEHGPGPAGLERELQDASALLVELGGETPVVISTEHAGLTGHRLVLVRKERPTPRHFPRVPAERRRRLLR